MATVIFDGKRTAACTGQTLMDCAEAVGARVPSSCSGDGSCGECLVEVLIGMEALSPRADAEEFLTGNYRLACQAEIVSTDHDVVAGVLKRQRQIVSQGADQFRARSELAPQTRRQGNQVVRDGQVIDTYSGRVYGIAADIGTTTVALALMDLETGATVYTTSFENPQTFGGSDVVNRIHYDRQRPGELKRVLTAFLNQEISQMPCRREDLYEMVVVGNTTMRDLLAGLDVQPIGQKPFRSLTEHALREGNASTTALVRRSAELGIELNPNASVYFGPLISCHVGADAAACLLATRLYDSTEPVLLMDIGTNTEVILGNRDRMVCASCAAGPAFEGGRITYGMPGVEGAIESVVLKNGGVSFKTIGDVEPQGICGSGLIDLVAELVRHGRLSNLGRFVGEEKQLLIHSASGITFFESDVQELAQSKGATHAGVALVLKQYPAALEAIHTLHLAGGFAQYIDVANAELIGLTPPLPPDRIQKVGNVAAEGAKELLLSAGRRRELEQVVQRIEHIELEADPDFFTLFVEGCTFEGS